MCQVHIARPATLGDVCTQINLGFDCSARIQHVADLQQSQLGDANAGGMGEPQQHHITLWHAASYGCNTDQVLELSKAKRSSAAGVHAASLSRCTGIVLDLERVRPARVAAGSTRSSMKVVLYQFLSMNKIKALLAKAENAHLE